MTQPIISSSSTSSSIPSPSIEEATLAFRYRPNEATLHHLLSLIDSSPDAQKQIKKLVYLIAGSGLFHCSKEREAMALIEPFIKNKKPFKDVAKEIFLSEDFYCEPQSALFKDVAKEIFLSEDFYYEPQSALWVAVMIRDTEFFNEVLKKGGDVNKPLYPTMSALLLACKRGDCAMVEFLLEAGAQVQFVGGCHEHKTPLSAARLRPEFSGTPLLQKLEELDGGFTREFETRKRLGHHYSVTKPKQKSNLGNTTFHYEGARLGLVNNLETSREFYRQFQEDLRSGNSSLVANLNLDSKEKLDNPLIQEKICNGIDEMLLALEDCYQWEKEGLHANPDAMKAAFLNRLSEGKPLVCFGITRTKRKWITGAPNSHAWGFVITKDPNSPDYIVQRCNRGYGTSEDQVGILKRKMTEEEVTTLIEEYTKALNWKVDVFGTEESISIIQRRMNGELATHIPQKGQTLGTCCVKSAQSIELALLCALLDSTVDETDLIPFAKAIKRARTAFTRNRELHNYLIRHEGQTSPFQPDSQLLFAIYNDRKKISPECQRILSNSFQKELENHALQQLWNHLAQLDPFKIHPKTLPTSPSAEEIRQFFQDPQNHSLIMEITALELKDIPLLFLPPEINCFSNLLKLTISHGNLESIPPLSLPKLETLDLSSNALTALPPLNLPRLKRMSLSYNKLTTLPPLNLDSLETLFLNGNRLKALPESLSLPALKELGLQENALREIPNTWDFPELRKLYVKDNQLLAIPNLQFPKLTREDRDKSDLIQGFFTSRKPGLEEVHETNFNELVPLFNSITNPMIKMSTLVDIFSNSTNITKEIVKTFYAAVSTGDLLKVSLGKKRITTLQRAYFIKLFFQKNQHDWPFPMPDAERLLGLITLFKEITAEQHLLKIFQTIVTSDNATPLIVRAFYDALPPTVQQLIEEQLQKGEEPPRLIRGIIDTDISGEHMQKALDFLINKN